MRWDCVGCLSHSLSRPFQEKGGVEPVATKSDSKEALLLCHMAAPKDFDSASVQVSAIERRREAQREELASWQRKNEAARTSRAESCVAAAEDAGSRGSGVHPEKASSTSVDDSENFFEGLQAELLRLSEKVDTRRRNERNDAVLGRDRLELAAEVSSLKAENADLKRKLEELSKVEKQVKMARAKHDDLVLRCQAFMRGVELSSQWEA